MLVELQTLSITVGIVTACISVVIAVVNQILSRRRTEKTEQLNLETRQAQLFMQLYDQWKSPEFRKAIIKMMFHYTWNDVDDFMSKYGYETNPEVWVDTFIRQATFYEGVGVLVEKGLIDIKLVDRLLHNTILNFWDKMGPIWKELRKNQPPSEDPYYDSTEYLYNLIQKKA